MIEFLKRLGVQIGWGVLIGSILFVVMLDWETVFNGSFKNDGLAKNGLQPGHDNKQRTEHHRPRGDYLSGMPETMGAHAAIGNIRRGGHTPGTDRLLGQPGQAIPVPFLSQVCRDPGATRFKLVPIQPTAAAFAVIRDPKTARCSLDAGYTRNRTGTDSAGRAETGLAQNNPDNAGRKIRAATRRTPGTGHRITGRTGAAGV